MKHSVLDTELLTLGALSSLIMQVLNNSETEILAPGFYR